MAQYKLVGISKSETEDGRIFTHLHAVTDFPDFYQNPETGRVCEGKMVENINAGAFDCSHLKIGQLFDVYYEKAVQTKTGAVYQPIKNIIVSDK